VNVVLVDAFEQCITVDISFLNSDLVRFTIVYAKCSIQERLLIWLVKTFTITVPKHTRSMAACWDNQTGGRQARRRNETGRAIVVIINETNNHQRSSR